jgi:uncharacterized protein (DUF1501 family)
MIPRRVFLRDGGLAVIGLSMVPGFLVRTLAQAAPLQRKTLVVIFRGGADGLNIVAPFGDSALTTGRTSTSRRRRKRNRRSISTHFGLSGAARRSPRLQAGQFGISMRRVP